MFTMGGIWCIRLALILLIPVILIGGDLLRAYLAHRRDMAEFKPKD